MNDSKLGCLKLAAGALIGVGALAFSGAALATENSQERQQGREVKQDAKQEARSTKVDCRAENNKSNAECRQDKRDTKQDGRQEKRDIKH